MFDEESYVARSLTSEMARDMLILPQLRDLVSERGVADWKFPAESIEIGKKLIEELESGELLP